MEGKDKKRELSHLFMMIEQNTENGIRLWDHPLYEPLLLKATGEFANMLQDPFAVVYALTDPLPRARMTLMTLNAIYTLGVKEGEKRKETEILEGMLAAKEGAKGETKND